ncbi:MAG: permease prefix domain 1-containing protein [Woeseiaceae bacterium]|nr:permease prefix domain 1-containing protein [Woeseiaceae bacterium]
MRNPDLRTFAKRLLDAGIAPKHVHRTVNEMRDHYEDLVEAGVDQGLRRSAAHERALERLGRVDDLVREMAAHPELRTWASRYPRAAIVIYPLACLAVLPAVPIVAGVANAPLLARWGASLIAAGIVTAGMLLILQLSILFG